MTEEISYDDVLPWYARHTPMAESSLLTEAEDLLQYIVREEQRLMRLPFGPEALAMEQVPVREYSVLRPGYLIAADGLLEKEYSEEQMDEMGPSYRR